MIRFPDEYYIVPLYTPAPFVDVLLISFVLQTKVTGFGRTFSILVPYFIANAQK